MKIAFARGSLTKVAHNATPLATLGPLERVRRSSRLRNLRAKRRRDGVEVVRRGAVVQRHLSTERAGIGGRGEDLGEQVAQPVLFLSNPT